MRIGRSGSAFSGSVGVGCGGSGWLSGGGGGMFVVKAAEWVAEHSL